MSALPTYPTSPAYPNGGQRAVPMQTPPARPYNPQVGLNVEANAQNDLTHTTSDDIADAYGRLTPEQRQSFAPQTQSPLMPGTSLGRLHGVGPTGKVTDQVSDNTEGVTRQNFSDQFQQALRAGKGDDFLSKYTPQTGYQEKYDAAAGAASTATQNRTAMRSPLNPDLQPPEDPRVTVARINSQGRLGVAQSTNQSRENIATQTNQGKLTVAQWANQNRLDLGSMTAGQKEAAQKEIDRHNQETERIMGMNADTNATKAGAAGQPNSRDMYNAYTRFVAGGLKPEEAWDKAHNTPGTAPSTRGANTDTTADRGGGAGAAPSTQGAQPSGIPDPRVAPGLPAGAPGAPGTANGPAAAPASQPAAGAASPAPAQPMAAGPSSPANAPSGGPRAPEDGDVTQSVSGGLNSLKIRQNGQWIDIPKGNNQPMDDSHLGLAAAFLKATNGDKVAAKNLARSYGWKV